MAMRLFGLLVLTFLFTGLTSCKLDTSGTDSLPDKTSASSTAESMIASIRLELASAGFSESHIINIENRARGNVAFAALSDSTDTALVAPKVLEGALMGVSDISNHGLKVDAVEILTTCVILSSQNVASENNLGGHPGYSVSRPQYSLAGYTDLLKTITSISIQYMDEIGIDSESLTTTITVVVQGITGTLVEAGIGETDIPAVLQGITEGAVSALDDAGISASDIADAVNAVTSGAFQGLEDAGIDEATIAGVADDVAAGAVAGLDDVDNVSDVSTVITSIKTGINDGLADAGVSSETIDTVQDAINDAADGTGDRTLKTITAFSFTASANSALSSDVTASISDTSITATVPSGTDVTALVATFTTTGASVKVGSTVQTSGTSANDFSSSVTYTVTADDGSTQDYTVTVTVAPSDAKDITAFTFTAAANAVLSGDVTAGISGTSITATVPSGTDVTALVATFTTTGASVKVGSTTQTSETTANDFSSDVTYTVIAADSSEQDYTVTVSIAGATVSSISGDTDELGTQATFTVKLNIQPTNDVTIPVSSSDTTEGTVSPSSLTFTASNWDTNQTVTVTGVHDTAADGDQAFTIILGAASSSDPAYNGLDPDDVSVTNAAVSSATGSLDTAFNSTGYATHDSAAGGSDDDNGNAMTIDSNGKILVAGISRNASTVYVMAVWRYNSDGSLDTTFNSTGYAVHGSASGGKSIASDADGKILVAGNINSSNEDMALWRYNSDGSLDSAFNSTGYVVHDNAAGGSGTDYGRAITIDSDGKILVAGYSYDASSNIDMVIWRYNTDGSLDTTFNSVGYTVYDNAAGGSYGYGITIDADGKILVTGQSSNGSNMDLAIWRYNTDGSLDTSFNSTGYAVHDSAAGGAAGDYGNSITIDSNGKILVTGYSVNASSNSDMAIWRYNTDGSLDTTFNSVGYTVHDSAAGGSDFDQGTAITIDSNGKIIVAGYSSIGSSNYDMAIWRYNTDGSLDTTFNSVGYTVHNNAAGGNGSDYGHAIMIDSNGYILVNGTSASASSYGDMAIWRYE